MIQIRRVLLPLPYDERILVSLVASRLGVDSAVIRCVRVSERELVHDGGDSGMCYRATLTITIIGAEEPLVWGRGDRNVTLLPELQVFHCPNIRKAPQEGDRPIVVGSGPAGLFAAYLLARAGMRPLLMERGRDIRERDRDVARLMREGVLDPESNVAFGAGGAGTYSDGKLKPGSMDPQKRFILETLVEAGAPEDILVDKNPHVGTDVLRKVVSSLLCKIRTLGGEVCFSTRFERLLVRDGCVTGAEFRDGEGVRQIGTHAIVLATGHGARDTVKILHEQGVPMEAKPFGIGLRIEHPQEHINRLVYKTGNHPELPAASYRMVVHLPGGRSVYTFCMCPGGVVVPATNEAGAIVTNGMSYRARSGRNANAALLVSVLPEDIGGVSVLAGFDLQQRIERAAYAAGGGSFRAPVQRLEDFMNDKETSGFGEVLPTYLPGTTMSRVDSYLPSGIARALRAALPEMGEWMPGYLHPDAILTGAETRSTSPVRILRDESGQAPGFAGLYPCGEGAGYAGGILSAALDGMRTAQLVLATDTSF